MAPGICKPNGYLRKRISVQIEAKSLESTHWCEYMDIAEFDIKRSKDGQKSKMPILDKEGILGDPTHMELFLETPALTTLGIFHISLKYIKYER